jgi:hypothetical protein
MIPIEIQELIADKIKKFTNEMNDISLGKNVVKNSFTEMARFCHGLGIIERVVGIAEKTLTNEISLFLSQSPENTEKLKRVENLLISNDHMNSISEKGKEKIKNSIDIFFANIFNISCESNPEYLDALLTEIITNLVNIYLNDS